VFLLYFAFAAETAYLIDFQLGPAMAAKQAGHVGMGHFFPLAREAGALPADAVANVVQVNVDFFHEIFLLTRDDVA
jgi:hypothetical protein